MSKRPVLKNLIKENTLAIESFQNNSLRPIIKMQHHILIVLFKDYLLSKKIDFDNLSMDLKREKIKSILQKDNSYKRLLIGVVVGQFSQEELNVYLKNSSELNRRILQIISQRLQDSLSEIK